MKIYGLKSLSKSVERSNAAHKRIIQRQPDTKEGMIKVFYHSSVHAEQYSRNCILSSSEKRSIWRSVIDSMKE